MPAKDSTEKYLFVHKTRVHVNNKQVNFFRGCAGFRRVAYNWALAYIKDAWEQREERISTSKADMAFNAIKRDEFPWAYDYPSCVGQIAIKYDLRSAFDGFFRRVKKNLKLRNMTKSAKGTADAPGKNVKQKSGLNREILNSGLYEIRRQLEYKTQRHKGMLLAVDPKFTSQMCSECGHVAKENRKSQAVFICSKCGFSANADVNAAINIKQRGILELSAETLKAGPG
jgi:transposase